MGKKCHLWGNNTNSYLVTFFPLEKLREFSIITLDMLQCILAMLGPIQRNSCNLKGQVIVYTSLSGLGL